MRVVQFERIGDRRVRLVVTPDGAYGVKRVSTVS